MTVFTKQEIQKTFLKLINENPLSQITIDEIAKDCGINRNTFYYHFKSISDLIEITVKQFVDELKKSYISVDSFEDCFKTAIKFAQQNQKAVYNIYSSEKRAIFETNLWEICDYIVSIFIQTSPKSKQLSEEDAKAIKDFLKCTCFGFVVNWIKEGMPDNVVETVRRLSIIAKRLGLS